MENHLHIVCLDVPYPVDYGGVFDLFHKIRYLHGAGVKIHLHCFEYGRGKQPILDEYCVEVNYYERHEGHKGFSHKLPYIVCSRSNGYLLERLLQDNYPVLLEGIHCTYLLNDPRFKDRKVVLRLHNVEYQYYRQLYLSEKSLLKKLYYLHESNLLRQYEHRIADKVKILAVSPKDSELYRQEFGAQDIDTLPIFLPFEEVRGKEGTGCFCLYHGNLSVAENEQVVIWLLKKVFSNLEMPFIVSGKNPSSRLTKLIYQYPHTCLIPDPSEDELQDLIAKAQINILPSFNCTGIKLKLLNALYNGRHCIVNTDAVEATGLQPVCHLADNAEEIQSLITRLSEQPFTHYDIESRKTLLGELYNQENNLQKLLHAIW
ncbi:MAG: glycosyltransferase [Bacteroidetes bacterium]|nr:glycosyltransferase [Bacteroidota bacterium]